MSTIDPSALVRGLDAVLVELQQDSRLRAELARARRDFFGDTEPIYADGEVERTAVYVRFAEWYLLERESEVLGVVPLRTRGDTVGEEIQDCLLDSRPGVFLVERVDGEEVQARDLQDETCCDLSMSAGSVAVGDLLVGRLYLAGEDCVVPSPVLSVHRDGRRLASALLADLQRLDLDRRLTQLELEHLILRRAAERRMRAEDTPRPAVPLERLEADLERQLQIGGAENSATEISAALGAAPQPGAVMGSLLDDLAFHTAVDLETVRRLLLEIWNAHRIGREREGPVAPEEPTVAVPRPAEGLGQSLVRRLDEGLARHEDVGEIFADLDRMVGGGESAEGEATAIEPQVENGRGPVDLGDLAPLVREFLWETGQDGAPAGRLLEDWVAMQRNAPVPRTDLESVSGDDLTRLLLHRYLAAPPERRAAAVRDALAVTERFLQWAAATQEYDVANLAARGQQVLGDDVDRLQRIGLALSTSRVPDPDGPPPCLMHVEEVADDGFGVHHESSAPVWIPASAELCADLRVGDLVLGALQVLDGEGGKLVGMVVVLPAEAEALVS